MSMSFEEMKSLSEEEQSALFKSLNNKRQKAKITNFSSQFGIGSAKLAKQLDIPIPEARKLIQGFKKRNWAMEASTRDAEIKTFQNKEWVRHPINGYWYLLRKQRDLFSVFCQGGGSWLFYIWGYFLIKNFGVDSICVNYHDEFLLKVKDDEQEIKEILEKLDLAMEKVNETLNLNIDFKVDSAVGDSYSDVH